MLTFCLKLVKTKMQITSSPSPFKKKEKKRVAAKKTNLMYDLLTVEFSLFISMNTVKIKIYLHHYLQDRVEISLILYKCHDWNIAYNVFITIVISKSGDIAAIAALQWNFFYLKKFAPEEVVRYLKTAKTHHYLGSFYQVVFVVVCNIL